MTLAILQGDASPPALRAALDSVFASSAYRWASTPAPIRRMHEWWERLGQWLEGLRAGNPAVFRLLVAALLVALVLVLAHGAWVVWQTVRSGAEPDDSRSRPATREIRDAAWYFREADRAAVTVRTAEALQLAFVGLALTLDRQGLLRYDASKTPAECAREAHLAGADRERLRGLVRALYSCAFGGHPCDADDYRRWREDVGRPWHAPAH